MNELSINIEWNLQEESLKPETFSKNHKISHLRDLAVLYHM